MRVLLTGVAGFVGRYLSRLLAQQGHDIFGTCHAESKAGLPAGIRLLECDIRKPEEVIEALKQSRPERVYHLAAFSSSALSSENWIEVYDTNLFGTLNLLQAVTQEAPKARVLVVGSGQCYGTAVMGAMLSERHPLLPETPYAVSKAAADLAAYQFSCARKLHVVRARPFNHTGPGQRPDFVCSDFARQIAAIDLGLVPPVLKVGNLGLKRDFTDVRDVVRAYQLLLEKGSPGEAYNVCSGRARELREIVATLQSFCRRRIRLTRQSVRLRRGDPPVIVGSSRKLQRATLWKSEIAFAVTLHDLFTYWRAELQESAGLGRLSDDSARAKEAAN